ncbi:LytTR family DNA-binding domain-containing protein [uncultured Bacteroides sp.]|uniref:LytR/AlgR family response regulator transcription factor n=1 Tax=uncultured Bacteroides sp. TaxID=162156 RepID=UPI0025F8D6E6|nr:LytTR family DNA-binding domain-containing protein [uncultured Bacteroides sp.]
MNARAITTIIVDDEINAIQNLSEDLNAYPDINILETTTSALKAQKSIIKLQPDLLFIDIEMPKINGIDLLKEIRPYVHSNMHVVFYSAFDKYMIDALRASAFDYLLKPYQPSELKTIIDRVRKRIDINANTFEQSMRRLLSDDCKFALQTITSLLLLRCSEILYFRYLDDARCWQVTLTNMECHRLRMTIKAKDILSLSQSFIRINSNCILNIEYLSSIENNTLRCVLYAPFSHLEIIASRRYYSKIKEVLEIL